MAIIKTPTTMKRFAKNFAAITLGIVLLGACTKIEEPTLDVKQSGVISYCSMPVYINSSDRDISELTRIEVGDVSGGKISYKWSTTDSIGVFLLNVQPKEVNNAVVGVVSESNPKDAQFNFNAEFVDNSTNNYTDMETSDTHLDMFVYYPYNSSMVVPKTYTSGANRGEPYFGYEYLHSDLGLVYRVPALQTMLEQETGRQGCTKAMTRYGVCYDFLRYDKSDARFSMRHQNAYLRVRVTGSQDTAESIDYGSGEYLLKKVIVRATYPDGGVEQNANIAGTYHMGYDYVGNGSTITGDEVLTTISSGGITHVSSELHTPLTVKPHNNVKDGSADDAGTYALLTISPLEFVSKGVNALYLTVELVKQVGANESAIVSITRKVSIASDAIKAGGLYDITFNAKAPADVITDLDAEDAANTYIITSPGDYSFTADKAGNGVLPYKTTFAQLGIGENLMDDSKHYGVDWLWASGKVFEGKSVEDVCDFYLDSSKKEIFFTLKDGLYNATGNLVLALYEKQAENNDTVKEIVWSWHLWMCEPENLHFRFANTRASIALNNEEWHMLDRNLGAEAADLSYNAIGTYYQVGRKDPFIGPNTLGTNRSGNSLRWSDNRIATLNNTAKFGVLAEWKSNIQDGDVSGYNDVETYRHKYPMWIIDRTFEHAHLDKNKYAWVHTEGQADFNTKTLHDPCPPGYKLPTTREWDNFKNNEFEFTDPAAFSSGPLGYCMNKDAEASDYATSKRGNSFRYPETAEAWETLQERVAAGEYYEVDAYNGRRYHTLAMSAHGDEIISCFPTTGALREDGYFLSLGYNFALWASGRVEPIDGSDYSNTRYDAHWFGIKSGGDWKDRWSEWSIYSPYQVDIKNNPLGVEVDGIGEPSMRTQNGVHSGLGTASNYAAPIRCIRQYDSTAGQ